MLTRGTGYLGSYLAKELLEKGYRLRLSIRDAGKIHKLQPLLQWPKTLPAASSLLKPIC